MCEFTHSFLLTNDINIVRPVHFLKSLDGKSWEETDNRYKEETCPEGCLSIYLCSSTIEERRRGEGSVHSSPEENEYIRDDNNEHHQPIPTIGVDQNVHVDRDDGGVSNVGAKSKAVLYAKTIASQEGARHKQKIRNEENHDGLINTINHVEPLAELAQSIDIKDSLLTRT
jgi:hypothetical protein